MENKKWYYQFDAGRSMGKTSSLYDADLEEFVRLQMAVAEGLASGETEKSWTIKLDGVALSEDRAGMSGMSDRVSPYPSVTPPFQGLRVGEVKNGKGEVGLIGNTGYAKDAKFVLGANYDLSVKNPNKKEEAALRLPEEILAEMRALDEESATILDSILELL